MHIKTENGWKAIEHRHVIPAKPTRSLIQELNLPSDKPGYYAELHCARIDRALEQKQ